jgi:cell division protease FtsH
MTDSNDLRAPVREHLAQRNRQLQQIAAQLKTELFGIDAIIDRVIDSVRAWYVLPELVSRPVIVCLWGLTGTGKTQLVRRLAQLLGFYDRFVEVQMDGFSNGASWRGAQSISGMLAQSGVREGEPGILSLDEFQRFRTIDAKRSELRVERYQDVWALLSDGRLPPGLSLLGDIESSIAEAAFDSSACATSASAASSNGRPTTTACSSSSAATSTRCTKASPPAWTTATAMPTSSTR